MIEVRRELLILSFSMVEMSYGTVLLSVGQCRQACGFPFVRFGRIDGAGCYFALMTLHNSIYGAGYP